MLSTVVPRLKEMHLMRSKNVKKQMCGKARHKKRIEINPHHDLFREFKPTHHHLVDLLSFNKIDPLHICSKK